MGVNIRVVVVDDERPARAFLVNMLHTFDDAVVVGEAASGEEALALIERERSDLVLLDVHMPGLDGFGVVHLLGDSESPAIVFVTAIDDYADLAREVGAIGYLLKPVYDASLILAIAEARRRLESAEAANGRTVHSPPTGNE